jgi:hypothetical protein
MLPKCEKSNSEITYRRCSLNANERKRTKQLQTQANPAHKVIQAQLVATECVDLFKLKLTREIVQMNTCDSLFPERKSSMGTWSKWEKNGLQKAIIKYLMANI